MDKSGKILILVEGAKTDLKLMKHLLHVYGIDENHEVVSYNTNIYTLYKEMFSDGDPSSIDLLQLLKEKEKNPLKKEIFNKKYTDILLIFDLDPHDPNFSDDKIIEMTQYFVESSDMGKLYINYPMIEAFYHMKAIPDNEYNSYSVSLNELLEGTYKQKVNQVNRNHDYTKFAVTRAECSIVIKQNIDKAFCLTETKKQVDFDTYIIVNSDIILKKQLLKIKADNEVSVLCTCAFYIVDYNPEFINNIK
jgi:hypothetical protein